MNKQPIKIALCLSGEPRYSMFCLPYIYESFINLGSDYSVDVFCHFREPFRALSQYFPKSTKYDPFSISKISASLDTLEISDKLKSKKDFYEAYTTQTNIIFNPILMFEGIFESFNMAKNYNSYDIYIRSRYDFITPSKIYIDPIIKKILKKEYDLFISEKLENKDKRINQNIEYNDQFAIGNFKGMERYSNLFVHLPEILKNCSDWRAEKWLYTHLNNSNVKIHQHYLNLNLIRKISIATDNIFPNPTYIIN